MRNFFLRIVALAFVVGSLYACADKKEANEEVQDADKTEMMEEEHQMDPIEGELMKEDSSHVNHDHGGMMKDEMESHQ